MKAKKKFNSLKKKPTVIAITGSQGKTTTKEILFEILKTKYKVGKTLENQNTDVGLSLSILDELDNESEVFIAEMGAIRRSEIANMCKIIKPDVSIVTDIGTQHIGIFGSAEKLFRAKKEIIDNLKPGESTVLNGDSEYCLKMIRPDCLNYVYYTKDSIEKSLTGKHIMKLHIHSESETDKKLTFKIKFDNKDYSFTFNGAGKHLIHNIAGCIAASLSIGMSIEEVQSALTNAKIKLPRLTICNGDNDTLVIEDTYSSNEKGFAAAVKFMNSQKDINKRIVVTKGIIELGRHKEHVYGKLVDEIKNDIDILITSDNTLHKMILKDNTQVQSYLVSNNIDFNYTIRSIVEPKDIILLEGRLHPSIISEIVSEEN